MSKAKHAGLGGGVGATQGVKTKQNRNTQQGNWAEKTDPVGLRINRFGSSLDRFTGEPKRLSTSIKGPVPVFCSF
jgi:hypothetical protein